MTKQTPGPALQSADPDPVVSGRAASTWRDGLPVLANGRVALRALTMADAPALLSLIRTEEVARFLAQPPFTLDGFERFIYWTERERAEGRYVCFAVVPAGAALAAGLFQLRRLEPGFASAEWGFAMGAPFWGTGIFVEAARMVVDFAIDVIGVRRLEARAAVVNGRANGALRKIGAVQEGVLRRGFGVNGRQVDQVLWSILSDEWRQARAVWAPTILH
jgi:RimJ/RimL family protein N-acetyltransferase